MLHALHFLASSPSLPLVANSCFRAHLLSAVGQQRVEDSDSADSSDNGKGRAWGRGKAKASDDDDYYFQEKIKSGKRRRKKETSKYCRN